MCQSSIYTEGASESALASIVTAPSCTSPPSAPLPLVVDSVPCDSTARRHANISRPPLDPSPLSYLIRLSWPWTPARGRPQRRRRPRRIAGLRLRADEATPDRRAGRGICGCFAVTGAGVVGVAVVSDSGTAAAAWRGRPAAVPWSETSNPNHWC